MAGRDGELGEVDRSADERVHRILAGMGAGDLELLEPPATVWAGIDDVLASQHARRAPAASTTQMVVEYEIDAADRVVGLGEGWAAFAADNGAPELITPADDRTLWSYFDRDEIRDIWRMVVARVRTLRRSARVPLRCDAPHARRWFEIELTPLPEDGVRFRSVLLFEEPRTVVPLLDPQTARRDDLASVPVCSWCGRGEHGAAWLDIEDLVRVARLLEQDDLPPISYGICGSCRADMAADHLVAAGGADGTS